MQDSTVDNRRAQVFYSHPITVKGIFLARNSPKSTMRVSRRNKISLAFPVLSHVPHTKAEKSDPGHSTPARAISQGRLNKDREGLIQTDNICCSRRTVIGLEVSSFDQQLLATTVLQALTRNGLSQTPCKKALRKYAHTERNQVQTYKHARKRLAPIHTATQSWEHFWSYSHFL